MHSNILNPLKRSTPATVARFVAAFGVFGTAISVVNEPTRFYRLLVGVGVLVTWLALEVSVRLLADRDVPGQATADRLNDLFAGHSQVIAFTDEIPKMRSLGAFDVSEEVAIDAKVIRNTLQWVENQAVLDDESTHTDLSAAIPRIAFHVVDYATVQALRSLALRPPVLSGSMVSTDGNNLVVHQRSANSYGGSYPGAIHTVGGAFVADRNTSMPGRDPDDSLLETIRREARDEIRMISWEPSGVFMLAREPTTGFFQFVSLGGTVRTNPGTSGNPEGEVVRIPFDRLEKELRDGGQWVPSGRMHILAWLAAGAPGSKKARFNGITATELYQRLDAHIVAKRDHLAAAE